MTSMRYNMMGDSNIIVLHNCVCECVWEVNWVLMWPELTDRVEDAAAHLLCVLRHLFLPLLVAGAPAMASPSSVALRYMHANVDGVVACERHEEENKP